MNNLKEPLTKLRPPQSRIRQPRRLVNEKYESSAPQTDCNDNENLPQSSPCSISAQKGAHEALIESSAQRTNRNASKKIPSLDTSGCTKKNLASEYVLVAKRHGRNPSTCSNKVAAPKAKTSLNVARPRPKVSSITRKAPPASRALPKVKANILSRSLTVTSKPIKVYDRQKECLIKELSDSLIPKYTTQEANLREGFAKLMRSQQVAETLELQFSEFLLHSRLLESKREQYITEEDDRLKVSKTLSRDLKCQAATLNRDLVQIQSSQDELRSSFDILERYIRSAIDNEAEAIAALPQLKQCAAASSDECSALEELLRSELRNLSKLEAKTQLVEKDIFVTCRLLSLSPPKLGSVQLSLYSTSDLNGPRQGASHASTPSPSEQMPKDKERQSDAAAAKYYEVIQLREPPLNAESTSGYAKWIRLSQCQKDSFKCSNPNKLQYSALTVDIPFDHVVDFDVTYRPHCLLMTEWNEIEPPGSREQSTKNAEIKVSLIDEFEQKQVNMSFESLIEEYLDRNGPLTKPAGIGFINFGYVLNDGKRVDETFWGTKCARSVSKETSAFYGDSRPSMVLYQVQLNRYLQHCQSTAQSLTGVFESSIRTIYDVLRRQNLEMDDALENWTVEGFVTVAAVDQTDDTISTHQHQEDKLHSKSSIRRSISTPNLFFENSQHTTNDPTSFLKLLENLKDIPGMRLVGQPNDSNSLPTTSSPSTLCVPSVKRLDLSPIFKSQEANNNAEYSLEDVTARDGLLTERISHAHLFDHPPKPFQKFESFENVLEAIRIEHIQKCAGKNVMSNDTINNNCETSVFLRIETRKKHQTELQSLIFNILFVDIPIAKDSLSSPGLSEVLECISRFPHHSTPGFHDLRPHPSRYAQRKKHPRAASTSKIQADIPTIYPTSSNARLCKSQLLSKTETGKCMEYFVDLLQQTTQNKKQRGRSLGIRQTPTTFIGGCLNILFHLITPQHTGDGLFRLMNQFNQAMKQRETKTLLSS